MSVVSASVGLILFVAGRWKQNPEGGPILPRATSNDALHVINELFHNAQAQTAVALSLCGFHR